MTPKVQAKRTEHAAGAKIILVGHCIPDSGHLRMTIQSADPQAQVVRATDEKDLRHHMASGAGLLLVNRVLDHGYPESEGVALIARLKSEFPGARCMLVSNFPEAQAAAVGAGALDGFGKRELGSARVVNLLRQALAKVSASS